MAKASLKLAAGSSSIALRRAGLTAASKSAAATLAAEFSGMAALAGRKQAQLLGPYTNLALSHQQLCFAVHAF